jgi:hypothetical protein
LNNTSSPDEPAKVLFTKDEEIIQNLLLGNKTKFYLKTGTLVIYTIMFICVVLILVTRN